MRFLLSLIFILSPLSALAAEAGFPSQTIWVSDPSAHEGDTVVVSAVVYNGESDDLRGTLVFLADDVRIGAREFELPGATSQVHSVEWKPEEGAYELAARIEGISAKLSQSETPPLSITIRPPPAPSATEEAVAQAVEVVSDLASTSAPLVSDIAQTVFTHTETFREAGIDALENYLEGRSGQRGGVAGTSTSMLRSTENGGPVSTLVHTAAAATLFVMKNVVLFYPIAGILILAVLLWLARKVRRPY